MIKNIFAFRNFNVACTDENGHQVVSEQGNILVEMLKDMLKRKVITPDTFVYSEFSVGHELRVKEILNLRGKKAKRS